MHSGKGYLRLFADAVVGFLTSELGGFFHGKGMNRDIPRRKVRYTPYAAKCALGSFSRKRGYEINVYIRYP